MNTNAASVTSPLFEPLTLRGMTARNRIWVAPMCEYAVDRRDGIPTDWHLVHLGAMASGGAGLVMAEATAVLPEGRISPHDTGIWNDEQAVAWRRINDFIHSQGAATAIQLAHAGRKASIYPEWGTDGTGTMPVAEGGWQSVAPSAVAFPGYAAPVALDIDGIDAVVDGFAAAAVRSVEAGFDALEIHAAHGYLLHEFLSPISNLREDEYGGSLENRARLLLRVVRAIRDAVSDETALIVRFSGTDWLEGGWHIEETTAVAKWVHDAGVDLVDISSGGNHPAPITVGPGYQVPLAAQVRAATGMAVSAVGLITEPRQAEEIIARGDSDVVSLGREMMRDPHFALRAAHELGVEVGYWPPQYRRARWR